MQLTLLSAVDPAVRMALIPKEGMVKIHHLSEKQSFLLSIDSNVFFLKQSLSTFYNSVNNKNIFLYLYEFSNILFQFPNDVKISWNQEHICHNPSNWTSKTSSGVSKQRYKNETNNTSCDHLKNSCKDC